MLAEVPEDLKHLLPYLQRASELKSGFYAANLVLTKGYPRNEKNDTFLNSLFDELEKERDELKDEPAMHNQEQARTLVLQFAMKIFLAADNKDRAGQASKKTGRLFLVASQFLEITRVFGELPEEIEERIKYAKWKAADIIKALNEGRQPQPGPPGTSSPAETKTEDHKPNTFEDPPDSSQAGHLPSIAEHFTLTDQQRMPPVVPPTLIVLPPLNIPGPAAPVGPSIISAPTDIMPPISPVLDPMALSIAEKYARYAVSAIQFEDISTAIHNLESCLETLRNIKRDK